MFSVARSDMARAITNETGTQTARSMVVEVKLVYLYLGGQCQHIEYRRLWHENSDAHRWNGQLT